MGLTNKWNIPAPIVRAIENDDYDRGDSDISVTQLIDAPLQRYLKEKHKDEIIEDASDKIYALMGKGMHQILENAGTRYNEIAEERFFTMIEDIVLSGQIDFMYWDNDGWIIQDYKWMSVWEWIYGIKQNKVEQLNCLAYLARKNFLLVKGIEVVMLFRDWSKTKSERESNYPKTQVIVFPVELWSQEKQKEYVRKRVSLHFREEVGCCTPEERWQTETKYAVMKEGRKTALKVAEDLKSAMQYIEDAVKPIERPRCFIEERPGASIRCESYCIVKKFCPYLKEVSDAE